MTTKFGVGIAFRKAQLPAKFHCPAITVTLFSKDVKVIESQNSPALVELLFTIIHPTLDAEVSSPEVRALVLTMSFNVYSLHRKS